jgi:hypothetical protein
VIRIGREAARRFHREVADATQEARIVAWQKHEAGLPAKLVIQYTRQAMLSPERSPLRASSTSSRTEAEGMPGIGGFRSPLTSGQLRALARLTSSAFGGILSRLEDEAPLRCPDCGGRGTWGNRRDPTPTPDGKNAGGCVENEKEAAERWPMYDTPRKARDDQVWWCRGCGGWTWDPAAKATEVQFGGDTYMRVHDDTVGVDGEALLMRYVEAGRRGRMNDLSDPDEE